MEILFMLHFMENINNLNYYNFQMQGLNILLLVMFHIMLYYKLLNYSILNNLQKLHHLFFQEYLNN